MYSPSCSTWDLDQKMASGNARKECPDTSRLFLQSNSPEAGPHETSHKKDNEKKSGLISAILFRTETYFIEEIQKYIAMKMIDEVFAIISLAPEPRYLNLKNNLGQTPLHFAVQSEQADTIRRLICAGADPMQVDRRGNSAFHLAVLTGKLSCVRAITIPVARSETEAAKLSYPSSHIESKVLSDNYNIKGYKSIHVAVIEGHIEILKHLVEHVQTDINSKELIEGGTCLHLACKAGNDTMFQLLLDIGVDLDVANYFGQSPYALAKSLGLFSIQRLLRSYGHIEEEDPDLEDVGYYSDLSVTELED